MVIPITQPLYRERSIDSKFRASNRLLQEFWLTWKGNAYLERFLSHLGYLVYRSWSLGIYLRIPLRHSTFWFATR